MVSLDPVRARLRRPVSGGGAVLAQWGAVAVAVVFATATVASTTVDTDHGYQAYPIIESINDNLRSNLPVPPEMLPAPGS